jgi:hypothetical protein
VQGDLTYTEYPIKIIDTLTRVTRNKVIKMCKVQWIHHGEDEATWKREEECWRLVLKCYELRTRQHKMLKVKALRPSKHYFPWDIMIFRRRS